MNNEPDYKDNLAFEPEMTMQDVFDVAHNEYGWLRGKDYIQKYSDSIYITEQGGIELYTADGEYSNPYWMPVANNRTPRQVLDLIKGLGN